jgi:hypothetical protein
MMIMVCSWSVKKVYRSCLILTYKKLFTSVSSEGICKVLKLFHLVFLLTDVHSFCVEDMMKKDTSKNTSGCSYPFLKRFVIGIKNYLVLIF